MTAGWEHADLFDVMPADSGLLAEFWKNQVTETMRGQMAYRTRTTKAGERLEAEIYPIWGRDQEQAARRARQNRTPERQKQLNMISWNGGTPKYDIRDWAPDREKMGKGITLTEDEMEKLVSMVAKNSK